MLNIKHQKLSLAFFLLVGAAYFITMSNLEINYFLKSLIAFLPIQIAALVYVSHKNS
ncbi:hypothetical protein H6G27_24970 [Nostoc linckia FACHB-104]|nr:hypothetical protein [Nostoc linckia FACHB-104]